MRKCKAPVDAVHARINRESATKLRGEPRGSLDLECILCGKARILIVTVQNFLPDSPRAAPSVLLEIFTTNVINQASRNRSIELDSVQAYKYICCSFIFNELHGNSWGNWGIATKTEIIINCNREVSVLYIYSVPFYVRNTYLQSNFLHHH